MLAEINVSSIYGSTTGSLLQLIYICPCSNNSQHSTLANPDYNIISIEKYKQEIFPSFMLSLHAYVTSSLNRVYLEVVANI